MTDCEGLNKEPITDVAIRFQDCDPFGHLNNARYIDYFINVREDHLAEEYNLDIYERQKYFHTNWVVSNTKNAYISPVFSRETDLVKISIQGVPTQNFDLRVKEMIVRQTTMGRGDSSV